MQNKKKVSIVITSIAKPTKAIIEIKNKIKKLSNFNLIIIGDLKSPINNIHDLNYLSISDQKKYNYSIIKKLPYNSYTRKNIGYILSIKNDTDIIIDTDDDNYPYRSFFNIPNKKIKSNIVGKSKWINIYKFFTNKHIWPRGFPLELVTEKKNNQYFKKEVVSPVQQGLADKDPDVDSIYRLILNKEIIFKKNLQFSLNKKTYCPFNSQNTVWFKDAFPLLYLPSTCTFRMTDIWRSFIALRILHENNWYLTFRSPTMYQLRNEHNLLNDFNDEIIGYQRNHEMINILDNIKIQKGKNHIKNNLIKIYNQLINKKYFKKIEMDILKAWLKDIS